MMAEVIALTLGILFGLFAGIPVGMITCLVQINRARAMPVIRVCDPEDDPAAQIDGIYEVLR